MARIIRERVVGSERSEVLAAAALASDGSLLVAGSIRGLRDVRFSDGWLARVEDDWILPSCSSTTISPVEGIPPGQSYWSALGKSRPFGQNASTDAVVADATVVRLEPCGTPCGLTPPGEISGPPWTTPLRVTGRGSLRWDDSRQDCERYTVHRGRVVTLRSGDRGACLASDLLVAAHQDDEDPGMGQAWFYLVAAMSAAGEGSLGADSFGMPQPNPTPCP